MTQTNEHTPGPWTTDGERDQFGDLVVTHNDNKVAMIIEAWPYRAAQHANCRLIAAAPDLLAALEHVERCGYDSAAEQIVPAAIAKATRMAANA